MHKHDCKEINSVISGSIKIHGISTSVGDRGYVVFPNVVHSIEALEDSEVIMEFYR